MRLRCGVFRVIVRGAEVLFRLIEGGPRLVGRGFRRAVPRNLD